jgi:hypothetical protein
LKASRLWTTSGSVLTPGWRWGVCLLQRVAVAERRRQEVEDQLRALDELENKIETKVQSSERQRDRREHAMVSRGAYCGSSCR